MFRYLKALDLFCGAGGAATGLHQAGFEVTGIDIKPQPRFPFEFIQADALNPPIDFEKFDLIWASPPCQAYSMASLSHRKKGKKYPDLIDKTRQLLKKSGVPYIIENVPGAPIRGDISICGCQVGLALRRKRWFETSWNHFVLQSPCHHPEKIVLSVVGHGMPSWSRKKLGYVPTIKQYREAMGIDWMTMAELSQAIPPAYSEYIAREFKKCNGTSALPA